MSRQYDAKQHVLKAYPEDRESGIDMFLDYLDVSRDDFEYEEGMTPEEYIYGGLPRNEVRVTDDFGNDWYFPASSQPKTE